MKSRKGFKEKFTAFSTAIIKFTGSPYAFAAALGLIILWAGLGPVFKFSNTRQLVVNSGTTIITFLIVFLIQQSQNRDTMAMQLKLNELIASNKECSNRLVDIEDLTEDELETLKKFYVKLATLSKKKQDLHTTHSIDEAEDINEEQL